MEKGLSFSLLKALGRFSYDVTLTNYDVIPLFTFFRFEANAQDL